MRPAERSPSSEKDQAKESDILDTQESSPNNCSEKLNADLIMSASDAEDLYLDLKPLMF